MYQGHHSDGSGVQKHSAGSHYPFVVFVQERTAQHRGEAIVLSPDGSHRVAQRYTLGDRHGCRLALGRAFELAERLAAQHRARVGH